MSQPSAVDQAITLLVQQLDDLARMQKRTAGVLEQLREVNQTVEYPYPCDRELCGMRMKTERQLKEHLFNVHGDVAAHEWLVERDPEIVEPDERWKVEA